MGSLKVNLTYNKKKIKKKIEKIKLKKKLI